MIVKSIRGTRTYRAQQSVQAEIRGVDIHVGGGKTGGLGVHDLVEPRREPARYGVTTVCLPVVRDERARHDDPVGYTARLGEEVSDGRDGEPPSIDIVDDK